MITLDVFHNVSTRPDKWDGYEPGDPLVQVARWEFDTDDLDVALNKAYDLGNIGDDPAFGTPDDRAVTYRQARNRSLSMGDVLMSDGVGLAVASIGFEKVAIAPEQIVTTASYGSTPLGGAPATV